VCGAVGCFCVCKGASLSQKRIFVCVGRFCVCKALLRKRDIFVGLFCRALLLKFPVFVGPYTQKKALRTRFWCCVQGDECRGNNMSCF